MNKKDIEVLNNELRDCLQAHYIVKIEKDIELKLLHNLYRKFNLLKEYYYIKNNFMMDFKEISSSKKDVFNTLFEKIQSKFSYYIKFDYSDIDNILYDIEFQLNQEEKRTFEASVKYLFNLDNYKI